MLKMFQGILFSLIAGVLITLQGVFNSRASEKVGLWETTTLVHVLGLSLTLICLLLLGNGSFKRIGDINYLYLLGGSFGAVIVFSTIKGITTLGPTLSIAIVLITQLLVATVIDCCGLFGTTPIKFDITKVVGIIMMIGGIFIFKLKG